MAQYRIEHQTKLFKVVTNFMKDMKIQFNKYVAE